MKSILLLSLFGTELVEEYTYTLAQCKTTVTLFFLLLV